MSDSQRESRRRFLGKLAPLCGAAALTSASCATPSQSRVSSGTALDSRGTTSDDRRIKQAITGWCFMNNGERWDIETLARTAAELGCGALELIDPGQWHILRRHGLICAASKSHGFVRGMNNPGHHAECLAALEKSIDVTSAAGFPNVITFTGFLDTSTHKNGGRVDPARGIAHCVAGYKEIVGKAERANVTLVLEPLNTRDAAPMKGHPGYHGDHVDECLEIIRKVGSPSLKLLFDVYHVQVMDGDLIRRIRHDHELIGHVQVAGNPGRGPLDETQEINYPAVMRAFASVGYDGFVAHEWIPTGDPRRQLADSIRACDVAIPGKRS